MDDMVAELTLRINNQMNVGLDEMRAQMAGIEDDAAGIRTAMVEMNAAMNDLPSGMLLEAGLADLVNEAHLATAAINNIGVAIDEDTTKIKAMFASWGEFATPAGVGQNINPDLAMIPPEARNPDYDATAENLMFGGGNGGGSDDGGGGGDRKNKGNGSEDHISSNPIIDFFLALTGVEEAWEGEKDFAKFQSVALQTAGIEGLSGDAAMAEAKSIMRESYNQAYLSRGNVDDTEQAYFNLIRQHIPKALADEMMGPLTEAATAYDVPVDQLTQPLYSLYDQLKIPADQMNQGVAILGAASHFGHYYLSDFGQGLPTVASQFERLGYSGLGGEEQAAAALEAVRKGEPDGGTTSTDLADLMTYMTSNIASRFFDRTKRSEDLLGKPIEDMFEKYHIEKLDLPKFFDDEQAQGKDPLNAMVDYMHTIGAGRMSPTDANFVFNSLFHNQQASTAMQALLNNYQDYHDIQDNLGKIGPGFLDNYFGTQVQGDSAGVSNYDTLGTYLKRAIGQNTFGLFMDGSDNGSQTQLNSISPRSNAFNIPVTLNVNVDKSGNVSAYAEPGASATLNGQHLGQPGVNLRVQQGQVLGAP